MAGKVVFDNINIGELYDRPQLSEIWGYKGHQAFSRGVFTPSNSNLIVLFVTKEKQSSLTQYIDYISEDFLYWDGEEAGSNNQRIITSKASAIDIHLFYRHKHHQRFKYYGLVEFLDVLKRDVLPYEFLFQILGSKESQNTIVLKQEQKSNDQKTEIPALILSRRGQGKFRVDLFDLYHSCAITAIDIPEILKASHIKPWKDSNNFERLDPYNGLLLSANLDSLFDGGFISFKDNGLILISNKIRNYNNILNLTPKMKLKNVFNESLKYLDYHRDEVFQK